MTILNWKVTIILYDSYKKSTPDTLIYWIFLIFQNLLIVKFKAWNLPQIDTCNLKKVLDPDTFLSKKPHVEILDKDMELRRCTSIEHNIGEFCLGHQDLNVLKSEIETGFRRIFGG